METWSYQRSARNRRTVMSHPSKIAKLAPMELLFMKNVTIDGNKVQEGSTATKLKSGKWSVKFGTGKITEADDERIQKYREEGTCLEMRHKENG